MTTFPNSFRLTKGAIAGINHTFPKEALVGEDVDYGFLSRFIKITGGNIKNIALSAAFLAAGDSGAVKVACDQGDEAGIPEDGEAVHSREFGEYYNLVK